MRVAVTGASGFVGGHVARTLAAAGHRVSSFGRRGPERVDRSLPGYQQWDITGGPIDAEPVDAVVHCAALVGDWGGAEPYLAANVRGTLAVLETFPVARFVHMSTSSVYSDQVLKSQVREDAATGDCTRSVYGRTKAASEQVVREHRPDAVILRPHVVYGPGDPTILPSILAARRLGHFILPGAGENHISVTHVFNLVHAVQCALHAPDARGAFNVSDGAPVQVNELLACIFARCDAPARLLHAPRAVMDGLAGLMELAWPVRTGPRGPLLTKYAVAQLADEHTLDISRAMADLPYCPQWTYRNGPL
ncbi:MAG: NAD(P)-dependent oxidoreductase [bacterium]